MSPISKTTSILIVALACLTMTACTTTKPVYNDRQATIASQLKPGDRVRITLINDRIKEIVITEVNEAEIKGTIHADSPTQRKGSIVVEEWADIFSVETVEISPLKTAGAAVGVAVAVPLVALGFVFLGAGAGY